MSFSSESIPEQSIRLATTWLQFLLEALLLSVTGAISGIILGVAAGDTLAVFLKADLIFPWGWSAVGVLFCSGIGIVFGLYPAQKAASLNPVEAQRHFIP